MKRFAGFAAGVVALALCVGVAEARPMTKSERSQLEQTLGQFVGDMVGGRYEEALDVLPPKIMTTLAGRGNTDVATLKAELAKLTAQMMTEIELQFVQFDVTNMVEREAADDQPYVLVPLTIEMDIGDGRFVVRSHTLAHLENGQWYLVRLEEEMQRQVLVEAYPQYAGITFPTGTSEQIR